MSAILGESLLFPQRNGPQIRLKVFGDEFYSYQEDNDGFSVIYDLARIDAGKLNRWSIDEISHTIKGKKESAYDFGSSPTTLGSR